MAKYDDLFAETEPDDSVFANKAALDPLASPESIRGRESQERELATILNGIQEGYLPPTVAIHGPPGTGETATTRRLSEEFAERNDAIAVEYVNLKECRSIFSAANEIHLELTGEKRGAYEGLDGVFAGIWDALDEYPEWTVLILDEIDHITQDANYAPSEFLYRLLRGEGKLKRDIQLSAWLISNELLEVDLRLDSRVESAMGEETVFFGPYGIEELETVVGPPIERAFREGALPDEVREYGIREAARRWGDARKALRLFRRAGETANQRGMDRVTRNVVDANLEATEREAVIEKLVSVPLNHFPVLVGVTTWRDRATGVIEQPVSTADIREAITGEWVPDSQKLGERAIRDILADLETMGLVEAWMDSRGREGRVKQIETTFDPEWVHEAAQQFAELHDREEFFAE